ncbi:MAG: restriction endonuclease subunit S [Verrucomicrobia bacterium]|nr:restriction endonuclease subunit S [Verrucomicrobiota bacterium]
MSGRLSEITVGEVCQVFDGPHATPTRLDSGPVFLGITSLNKGRIDLDSSDHVSEEDFAKWTRRVTPRPGDVVFSYETKLGEAAIIPEGLRCCLGRRMGLMRPDPQRLDSRFLLYYYLGPEFQDVIRERTIHGSTVERLALIEFPKFPLRIPPLAEQKAVAAVLGALDDKIELNRRMNATLEAMARALFALWIQRYANEIEEQLVENLIDERTLIIGDGYRAKNSEFGSGGIPFVRAGNLKLDGFDLDGAEILSARSVTAAGHKIGQIGDVAFTSKGTVGRITRVSAKTGSFVYSPQVCFWRAVDTQRLNPAVLYRWMNTDAFTRQVAQVSTQTDMAPYVSLQDQRKMAIQLPPPKAQQEVAKQLEPIDAKIAANAEQSRTLATLRDTLLPKLLSGTIRPNFQNYE